MSILECTQYQAALAVSGAWKGTNRYKIYEELGWESLDQRRFFRRLTQFYKIINNLTPEYLRVLIHHCSPIYMAIGLQTSSDPYFAELKDIKKTVSFQIVLFAGIILVLN